MAAANLDEFGEFDDIDLPDLYVSIQNGQCLRVREKLPPIQQQGAELIDRIVRAFLMEPGKETTRSEG